MLFIHQWWGGNHFVGTSIYLFIYLFIIVCCLCIKCQGNVNESSSPGGVYWWCGRWCLLSPWEQTSKSGRGFLEGEHPLWLLTFIGNTVMSKCWSTYHCASNFMGTQNLAKCKKKKTPNWDMLDQLSPPAGFVSFPNVVIRGRHDDVG